MKNLKDIIVSSSTPIVMTNAVVCRGNQIVFVIADEKKKYITFESHNTTRKPKKRDMFILWTQNGEWFAKSMTDDMAECVHVGMTKELKSMIMAEEV